MNDHEPGEGWHETCKRNKRSETEVDNQISIVLAQTVKMNRLIDTDNNQTLLRVRHERNELRDQALVSQGVVIELEDKIANLE